MNNNAANTTPTHAAQPVPVRMAGDRLVAELERLGLRYLSREPLPEPVALLAPELLITGLVSSPEARLRSALVPLFLWRPDYAAAAQDAAGQLAPQAYVMLLCCYTAAVALQSRYARALASLGRPPVLLPDLFAAALGLPPTVDPAARMAAVAARHAQLSGEAINWLGTYEHAAETFMRFAEPMQA